MIGVPFPCSPAGCAFLVPNLGWSPLYITLWVRVPAVFPAARRDLPPQVLSRQWPQVRRFLERALEDGRGVVGRLHLRSPGCSRYLFRPFSCFFKHPLHFRALYSLFAASNPGLSCATSAAGLSPLLVASDISCWALL